MGNIDRNKLHSKLKMDITIWIPVLLTIITLATPALSSEPRVVCYYTNWSVYRPGTARFNPQNINPYLCTHLVYAFGGFTKDNTLKPFDKYQDIEKGGYAKFTGLKTYNKNLKTLLAIGGWNEGSSRFSPMVASRDRRKEFVRNAIKFLRQNRFDGLDLDWEYPAFRDGAKPKDRENYAKLVKELREEFERESEKTNKPRLLLTMAVPAGIEYIQKGFDVKTLNQYLDWMNLLTYDYHSAFEPAVNHHAPLYPLEEPNEYSVDNELNIDYTIKFYLENGADPDKLVLGIPTYGRSYTLFNPDANEIGSPADGPGEQGDATREKGYLAYYEICEALKPKERKRSISSDEDSDEDSEEEEDEPWTVMQPNPKAMGPVAFKGNQWVGYDDVDIVRKKAEYVVDNGLGGIMFWSIDNDDFRGSCHGKPYPLIEAAKEAYVHKLESSDKTVTSKPASASRPSNKRKNRPRSSTTTTTQKPTTKANKRVTSLTSTTPAWNIITPEPPTTPDPGSDFKCVDEGFFPHPRDCKKYFWCLDSGPSDLGIVAHQFTCPSGLFFNKAADSCDFARNVLCKMPSQTTKAPATTAAATRAPVTSTTTTTTTTRRPVKLSTRNSLLFRTTTTSTTTPEPESEEEYEDVPEDSADVDAEDPKVIKELIDLIKKVGGIEQLEKQLYRSESSASTDGGATTPSSFNKKLYQKVLERARGKNKFSDNSISEGSALNSRRGPQNAGLEASADKDRLLKKDRPQYTTINRQRTTYTNTQASESEEDEEEEEEEKQQASPTQRSRPLVDSKLTVATTTRSLQYVNIRRARPTTVSDAADDSDSRNALFERSEQSFLPTGSPNSLDIQSARRENIPEYVTIRRQRPTTEETTTVQYSEEDEGQATALEREISSQPQYTSIVRTRSTTTPAPEEPSSPEPTTVLAVQISSLLNSPSSEDESPEPETTQAQTTDAITTTTTTTTTTPAPSIAPPSPPRRTVLRRRGSTSTTTPSAPTSTTQVSPRNYAFIRRRRPLSRSNELSDSDDEIEQARKIRSTTPDSLELEGARVDVDNVGTKRFRSRLLARDADSVPAAASQVSRGQFRPVLSPDELLSLTPIDVEPQFIPRQDVSQRRESQFRGRTTAAAEIIADSEASAATVEVKRPNILPRGRNRFSLSSVTEASIQADITSTTQSQRRPTYARFSPRPFTRTTAPLVDDNEQAVTQRVIVSSRTAPRLPFGRSRSSFTTASSNQARKLPFTSRQPTTPQSLISEYDDDEPDNKGDDITLSETAIEEKEHSEEEDEAEEVPKRRIIVKKVRPTTSTDSDDLLPTEAIPIDDNGRKKFRIIRRRPTSSTASVTEVEITTEANTAVPQRIRKIIRKKIRPVDDEPEISTKALGSLDASVKTTTEEPLVNYGEKRTVTTTTKIAPTTPEIVTTEQVTDRIDYTEFTIDENQSQNIKDIDQGIEKQEVTNTSEKNNVQEMSETTIDSISVTEKSHITEQSTDTESDKKPEIVLQGDQKDINISDSLETAPTESSTIGSQQNKTEPETTTTSTTTTTTTASSIRTRLPYRPSKRIFTSTTESSIPSSSRTFSRKFNPGVYTSPSTVEKANPFRPTIGKRPSYSSKLFTRRPFTTARTTQRVQDEEEEYSDEEILEEESPEPENPFVFVPPSQLFTRKPDDEGFNREVGDDLDTEDYSDDEEEENAEDENIEEESPKTRFTSTTRKTALRPKIINSNTFRTSTSTTEIPKRSLVSQNRTNVYNRFSSIKPTNDTSKKRVQNVPIGYNAPVSVSGLNVNATQIATESKEPSEVTKVPTTENNTETEDDYLTMTEPTSSDDISTTLENEIATAIMESVNSTNDYLEFTEQTTYYPSFQEASTTQTEIDSVLTTIVQSLSTTVAPKEQTTTTETQQETTTNAPVTPIVKTQFNKLFSVSRVVEISSKLDKHRLNKNNETTLIEEGKVVQEKEPVIDKIGEVSRFSLIKIFEDEIPIYLTKLGHVYPVENPPNNPIRIDEARNARALVSYAEAPKENLVASESMNEAYRHVNQASKIKGERSDRVEYVPSDDFLSYINDDKKGDNHLGDPLFSQWQFVPAAYENEKAKQDVSPYEIITPRSMLTNPSTLPLEALFKTENPMARKVAEDKSQPFVVYSASVPNQKEEANIVKIDIMQPESGRSIVTFAKGQEFNGGTTVDEATAKYPVSISILPQGNEPTSTFTTTTTERVATSPIIEMLSTSQSSTTTITTETVPEITTEESTTETVTEETTTAKISALDAKRSKFAFPRRPAGILKSSNITKVSNTPRVTKKLNTTLAGNLQRANKTSTFSPPKSRFSGNRAQNVPVDVKKKSTTKVPKTFTTEPPRTTTERKVYFKPIRPSFRPAFVPRKPTTTSQDSDT